MNDLKKIAAQKGGLREGISHRIRDWKGLLHGETRRVKLRVFFEILILCVSMTFTQCGFIGIGTVGNYACYVMGLLAPIAVTSLLLGKGAGTLQGLLAGGMLYAHSLLQPLDMYERYFVSLPNSVALYAIAGFLLGLLLAVSLRNEPRGARRIIRMGIVCLLVSGVVSFVFLVDALVSMVIYLSSAASQIESTGNIPTEAYSALVALSPLGEQILLDAFLMLGSLLLVDFINRRRVETAGNVSVRTVFRAQLLAVVALVYCLTQAVSFVAITAQEENVAYAHMGDELGYISDHLVKATEHRAALQGLTTDLGLPEEARSAIIETSSIDEVLEGYDLTDGTVLIIDQGVITYSYNPAYPVGKRYEELFNASRIGTLDELAEQTGPISTIYASRYIDSLTLENIEPSIFNGVELGYLRVLESNGLYTLMIMPSSMVFENRNGVVVWVAVVALLLLATVYVLVARLLAQDVVEPISRTNASLARITAGDLDETVSVVDSIEFASLSAGINVTVDSLKKAIAAEAARIDRDLATAKAIQESSLPRVFPPFPEVSAFDIYATMDPAKEVGGDFYDYFLIDDHTLGFFIADVSGKGIPGALFMMAAKTEIENHMSTGMEPVQAIASANRYLCANNDAGMFVTAWAATLDWETGLLTYVNAGHNFPLLRRAATGQWEWLKKKCGLFLGAFETAKYCQETLTLFAGDELLLYTDGVNEAFNLQNEEYGNDRLEAFAAAHADLHSRELVLSLRADVERWADGAEQSDDVTILALEYGVAPEVTGTITVPATVENLDQVKDLIVGELRQRLCPFDVVNKVELALEELYVNVCTHAYAGRPEPGEVRVSYAYGTDPSAITVELRDQGKPFDPTGNVRASEYVDGYELPVGGLGILMVRRSVDDFAYLRDGDTNITVFRKGW